MRCWESFIISLDILRTYETHTGSMLRIFHYQPWYTYSAPVLRDDVVENLSLSALIYLDSTGWRRLPGWESFIISLDILTFCAVAPCMWLRIFHYQPWYTYNHAVEVHAFVENLSLSALIYLWTVHRHEDRGWESFIISLDILIAVRLMAFHGLRIFHYQPWYTYPTQTQQQHMVENLSLSALIYLHLRKSPPCHRWESFIISLDILTTPTPLETKKLRIFHYQPWYT